MDFEELGRRAVACKGWRWMPGMLAKRPGFRGGSVRIHDGCEADGMACGWWEVPSATESGAFDGSISGFIPDLTDPATLGCLLALVREAWSCPTVCVVHEGSDHPDPWAVRARRGEALGIGVTEAEALMLALEAAPC